ncbi:MAG TPA: hypothetical protein VF495_19185 [Phenylobacterium sp.]
MNHVKGPSAGFGNLFRRGSETKLDAVGPDALSDSRLLQDLLQRFTDAATMRQQRAPEGWTFLEAACGHCVDVIDTTASLLGLLTAADVSLSMKLLWLEDGRLDPVVHTLFRSTLTRAVREAYEPTDNFGYRENTAFRLLAEQRDVTHFASDNLLRLFADGKYDNLNTRWLSFYVTTAVVPLAAGPELPILGFLCADSPRAKLDDEKALSLLRVAATHMNERLHAVFARHAGLEGDAGVPLGWTLSEDGLAPVERETQVEFQRSMAQLEHAYRYLPEFNIGQPATMHTALHDGDLDDRGAAQDEMAWLAGSRTDSGSVGVRAWGRLQQQPSAKQVERALERMARYNPDGAGLFRRGNVR